MDDAAPKSSARVRRFKVKRSWSKGEDQKLCGIVQQFYGEYPEKEAINWSTVSKAAKLNRNTKQVRERWTNKLDPRLRHGPFTKKESDLLRELQSEYGNQWTLIAKKMEGRSEGAVKNHWYSEIHASTKRPAVCDDDTSRSSGPAGIDSLDTPLPQQNTYLMQALSSHSSPRSGERIYPVPESILEQLVGRSSNDGNPLVPIDALKSMSAASFDQGRVAKAQRTRIGPCLTWTEPYTSPDRGRDDETPVFPVSRMISPTLVTDSLHNPPWLESSQQEQQPLYANNVLSSVTSQILPSLSDQVAESPLAGSPFRTIPRTPTEEALMCSLQQEVNSPVASPRTESFSSQYP